MTDIDRRKFISTTLTIGAVAGLYACVDTKSTPAASSSRAGGANSVMGLIAPRMDRVRVGLIGLGQRGVGFVRHFSHIEGAEVVALSDIDSVVLDRATSLLSEYGKPPATVFTGSNYAYRDMLARDDIDIVLIATPWRWHSEMAIDTMNSGKHAFVEVPAVTTVEEAWQIVNTAEATQKNCMMLENVCYGRDELMVLNLVRNNVFGELLHGEAAYIHELRWQMKEIERSTGSWRTGWHTKRHGNLYPTHGLGPVAQYMNINRGDRFDYMNSISSSAVGRAEYAKENFPPDHARNEATYINGDMSTTVIKTKKGRTIVLQHDTTTPRPYTRHNLIQGTNGVFAGFPNRIALEEGGFGEPDENGETFHHWEYDMEPWYARYEHPLYSRMGERSTEQGGHGGMDYLMCWRIIDCLRNGEPLDQDVYDAAAWSVIAPLSAESVVDRGNSRDIPDFTRGEWRSAIPLQIVS